jgi:DNA polymerase zeta
MNRNRDELLATRELSQDENFKVQINSYDSYQVSPTPFDRSSPPSSDEHTYHHVPIIRVYGSLPTGHNVLVHIHGVYPYLYIPYEKQSCFELQKSLEAATAASLSRKKDINEEEDDDATETNKIFKYIAHVSICKGIPFYGYHVGYQTFFKIYLLNPSYHSRVADLLRDGSLGRKFDVFEAHIPYGLQFLTDFNLFGCGWLRLRELFIRVPILNDESLETDDLVQYMMGYHTTDIPRIGRGALEIDTCAQYILNRNDLKERHLHHDFVEKFNKVDPDFIYIQSTKDLWKDGDFQRKLRGEERYSSPASVDRIPDVEWIDSRENQLLFDYIKELKPEKSLDFRSFLKKNPSSSNLPTAFGTISEMFYEPEFDAEVMSQDQPSAEQNRDEEDFDDLYFGNDYIDNAIHENFQNDFDEDTGDEDELLNSPKATSLEQEETSMGNITDLQFTQHFSRRFKKRRTSDITISEHSSVRRKLPKRRPGSTRYVYKKNPPKDLDFEEHGLPQIHYDDPFYNEIPPKAFIRAGKKFKLESKLLSELKEVNVDDQTLNIKPHGTIETLDAGILQRWKYIKPAPDYDDVSKFKLSPTPSQIGVTQGFKFATQATAERRPDGFNNLTVLIVEIIVATREDFQPDPSYDPVVAIVWRMVNGDSYEEGILTTNRKQPIPKMESQTFGEEFDMLTAFADLVVQLDPDIIAGYEVHASSWGYLIDRSRAEFDYEFIKDLSRCSSKSMSKMGDHWGYTHTSSIKICGRHVINIWRHLKELHLGKNTIEYVAYHLLHERIPHYTYKILTQMIESDFLGSVKYIRRRAEVDAKLIKTAEIIAKATEQARMIGIDFNDVFYRGSQYKVESLMMRIAKGENFMLLSPSKKQVRNQKPLECIPLVMEPISAYYKSPLVVLDFQSLYPSVVIAYNYCYSTLLGRLKNYSEEFNSIGTTKVKHPAGLLKLLKNDIILSPNGLMFAKAAVRKSLLAKMLEDILDTRFMVKSTMKYLDSNMKQLYNNRQLALKLTANVTYGYTSASFSGRMPCSDIADAIVQTGRETLEKAIELIENESSWGAKVVYGDTDSLFVYLPGRSREDAFKLGSEMATAITKANPDPVTLKFEKVYHPSLLMAKKRYVGYSYEHIDSPAKFDAKGIETVRRDGYPAQQHIVERSLRLLFETNNITEVKSFVAEQFNKIMNNDLSIQDFCFARAVKIGTYKNPPPGAIVSEKRMKEDSRSMPQYKERVPYVIIEKPDTILRERARSPEDFIKNGFSLDSEYYIVKTLIPPLERIFNLVGVDVKPWYTEMPKKSKMSKLYGTRCLGCGISSRVKLCLQCRKDELQIVLNSVEGLKISQIRMENLLKICRACSQENSILCQSHDCPVYFKRVRTENSLREKKNAQEELRKALDW